MEITISFSDSINLVELYNILYTHFGHRNWWPAETEEEIIIGAILAKNVSWINVKKAITNLKENDLCSFQALYTASHEQIAPLIRSTRFYNQKTIHLKNFLEVFYNEYQGSLLYMKSLACDSLRNNLLSVKGLGKETVDSILLYACELSVFVIDAYTKRIISRFYETEETLSYDAYQSFFTKNIPLDIALYNDFHAQLVTLGSEYCKPKPLCKSCILFNKCKKNIK